MAYLVWTDALCVGVEMFDAEHKQLIAIINELYDAFTRGVSRTELGQVCDRLIEYTLLHFRHEEMYFEDWAYSEKLAHEQSHRELKAQVFAFRDQILERPSLELATEIWDFLGRWLVQHVQTEDRRYGEFLREKGLC